MEDDLRKRNTDCVYFLASPLTCKKGVECEYRHSEIARLNPRDCWYWLSGNCLNQTCAFRHPPLEGHCEQSSQSDSFQSEPVKTKIPCYFFFNGFCNKGDTCSFLHGSDGSNSARIPKTVSVVKDVSLLEKKTFVGSDTGSVPTEAHPNSSQGALKTVVELQHQHNKNLQHSAPNNVQGESDSRQKSSSECDETAEVKSESSLPAEGFIQNRSLDSVLFSDQSSEDQVDGYIVPEDQVDGHSEPEERWESSPGFDVLVDDKSDDLGYEDDPEYPLSLNRDHRDVDGHLLHYGYEVQYDSTYQDAGILYEHGLRDSYHHSENEHHPYFVDKVPGHSREIMLNPMLCRKRKFLPRELSVNGGWSDVDLRDCLRKRRVIDGHPGDHIPRRHISSRQIGRIQERPRHHRTQQLRGRLASKVESNIMESLSEIKDHPSRAKQRGWFRPSQLNGSRHSQLNGSRHSQLNQSRHSQLNGSRHSQLNGSRHSQLNGSRHSQVNGSRHSQINESRHNVKGRGMAKERFLSSESSKEPISRRRRSVQESSSFSGPKTLSQIKEEKTKAREDGDCFGKMGDTRRNSSEAFQGPKPLSEILKDKKKPSSAEDGSPSSS